MSKASIQALPWATAASGKLRDYAQLIKLRLSSLVVFSSAIGYLFAMDGRVEWISMLWLLLAGFAVTASSNALNEVIEKDFDRLMDRTRNRPLPQERMSVTEALLVSGILGVGGIVIFWIYFNQLSAVLSAVALLSYAFIYTPLKRYSPVAVFVGALPGALPPLIGWVSATGTFSVEAFSLFVIQFMWQFPHFWAIAWVSWDDYLKAGYRLLPSKEGRNRFSALQNILFIIVLIPASLLPAFLGMTEMISSIIVVACGIVFLVQAIQLYKHVTVESARKLMFGSFIYLPVVLLALYLDRG